MDGPVDWWWKMSLLDVCVQAGFCQIRSHIAIIAMSFAAIIAMSFAAIIAMHYFNIAQSYSTDIEKVNY